MWDDDARLPARTVPPGTPSDCGRRSAAGEVVDEKGVGITETSAFAPRRFVLPVPRPSRRNAGAVRDRRPFIGDEKHLGSWTKPHFLASTPRGRYIAESALVRLRRGPRSAGVESSASPRPRHSGDCCCSPCIRRPGAATRPCSPSAASPRSTRAIARYDAQVRTPVVRAQSHRERTRRTQSRGDRGRNPTASLGSN